MLGTPLFRDLFERAFERVDINGKDAQAWLYTNLDEPGLGVWVAIVGGELQGLLAGFCDLTPFTPRAWGMFIYGGAPGVRAALMDALRTWLRERGQTRVWALNLSGMADEKWSDTFSPEGEVTRVASLFEIDLEA